MREMVILSGKGGTGKTSIAASLAHLCAREEPTIPAVIADADVDASNLELLLSPHRYYREEFIGGGIAVIHQEDCHGCGICKEICRFDAVREDENRFVIGPILCEGCAACVYSLDSDI